MAHTLLVARAERIPVDFLEMMMVATMAILGAGLTAYMMLRSVTTLRGWRVELKMRDMLARLAVQTLFLWADRDAFAPSASGVICPT